MYTLSRKKAIHTSRYAKKLEKRRKALYWVVLAMVFLIVVAITVILRSGFLSINSVVVTGGSEEKNTQVQAQIEKIATESFFYLIPKGTTLTFPSDWATKEILSHEPSVASLKIDKKGLKSLVATIDLRAPSAISCPHEFVSKNTYGTSTLDVDSSQGISETQSSTTIDLIRSEYDHSDDDSFDEVGVATCRFMDKHAFAYAQAPNYSPGVYVTFYATNTTAIGTHIEDQNLYDEFLKFNQDLKPYNGVVANVLFESGGEYEVQAIFNQASTTVEIFFNSRIPLKVAMDRVIKLIDSKYLSHKTNPGKTPGLWRLEYIDGRYGPTVYYKYK